MNNNKSKLIKIKYTNNKKAFLNKKTKIPEQLTVLNLSNALTEFNLKKLEAEQQEQQIVTATPDHENNTNKDQFIQDEIKVFQVILETIGNSLINH